MPSPLVFPEWLYEHLDDDQVCIVDCRFSLADSELGRRQYDTSHIPGAYYLHLNQDLSSPVQQHGGRHPLPDPVELGNKLAALGIHSGRDQRTSTQVVIYDDSNFAFAARLWWLLQYLGHDQVAVLDGGWKAWQAQGYPVTEVKPAPKTGTFVPQVRSDWVVDIDAVKARKDNPAVWLIDSREEKRYRGEEEPIDPIAGHIPGAVNYPWQQVVNEQGQMRSPIELRQHWLDLQNAEEVMVYCGSGVTACANLLAMAVADLPMGKLYPGSWSDWCSYLGGNEPKAKESL